MSTYQSLWESAEDRINAGIEKHRKSDAVVHLQNVDGKPLKNVTVDIEQKTSDFLFGANAFMLGGYASTEQNALYESAFIDLFNSATIPFYWKDLEPSPGQVRFAEGSIPIPRRPPPDRVVDFAKKHNLSTVGHPLVWDFLKWSAPEWLPADPEEAAKLWEKRIAQIAERYGTKINRWDVVNEVCPAPHRLKNGKSVPMIENQAHHAFEWAQRYLPASAFLMINETTNCWNEDLQAYSALIQSLFDANARVDGIGMQFHHFADADNLRIWNGDAYKPQDMLDALDHFVTFDRPIHISEITLTAPGNTADGEEIQATLARNYYRLWFSHAGVHAITWWNMPDGGAAPGEDSVASGLIRRDFSRKPAYQALHHLIGKEWRTNIRATTDDSGTLRFRGFNGGYQIRADGSTASIRVNPEQPTHTAVL